MKLLWFPFYDYYKSLAYWNDIIISIIDELALTAAATTVCVTQQQVLLTVINLIITWYPDMYKPVSWDGTKPYIINQ